MAIRLTNGCVNCQNLQENNVCSVHHTKVEAKYTCDSFDMTVAAKDAISCGTCVRFKTAQCAHPAKASAEMLCSSWAPGAKA
ncbi:MULTISPECIES: hypothetical protein [Capnocytophaga]|uniref:Uncharacterized protein n=1 Tax=Capnocytophaga canis TaxID=1848903 RepID=A0A0B7HVN5_9FLAO|nr:MULTISPECIES: hypothetical protein [Capnocytophaga]ATA72052.1 hypothetical protein CGC49_01195 [Capnocytophaga sp. H4358]ATA74170.1 hypothetical protein CGC52_01170 [Capnocytophaga sp. H2931]RIY37266.1 hypothetical protein CKY20_04035 [Capnocytophaga canis]CEN43696.1 conserved hypothetical protein [Capnocytophaga canis]CEN44309.1 conserved hypothetical protein [Capnocytophaga canis]